MNHRSNKQRVTFFEPSDNPYRGVRYLGTLGDCFVADADNSRHDSLEAATERARWCRDNADRLAAENAERKRLRDEYLQGYAAREQRRIYYSAEQEAHRVTEGIDLHDGTVEYA